MRIRSRSLCNGAAVFLIASLRRALPQDVDAVQPLRTIFYIYDEPVFRPPMCRERLDDPMEGYYTSFYRAFLSQAWEHPWRTRDPAAAELFVVPFDTDTSHTIWNAVCEEKTHVDRITAAIAALRASPWFQRRGGSDHFWGMGSWRLWKLSDRPDTYFPYHEYDVLANMTVGRFLDTRIKEIPPPPLLQVQQALPGSGSDGDGEEHGGSGRRDRRKLWEGREWEHKRGQRRRRRRRRLEEPVDRRLEPFDPDAFQAKTIHFSPWYESFRDHWSCTVSMPVMARPDLYRRDETFEEWNARPVRQNSFFLAAFVARSISRLSSSFPGRFLDRFTNRSGCVFVAAIQPFHRQAVVCLPRAAARAPHVCTCSAGAWAGPYVSNVVATPATLFFRNSCFLYRTLQKTLFGLLPPSGSNQITVYYRGKPRDCHDHMAAAARNQTVALKDTIPGSLIARGHGAKYTTEIKQAKFCLVLGCDNPQTSRFLDAMAAGCIPVTINNGYRLVVAPFSKLLNYDAFSIDIQV
ncbi:unnamed protein product [Phaeothamnion confervicola]